jgi:GAF domain-containing protein
LKIHPETLPPTALLPVDEAAIESLCRHFRDATGWSLRYVPACEAIQPDPLRSAPVDPGGGVSPGSLTIGAEPERPRRACDRTAALRLAATMGELLGKASATSNALWKREAELAAGIPVVIRPDEPAHLATRLQAVLKGGAVAIDADSAGLYMLDAATTELKLRSCWRLPAVRLLDPARPLRGSIGDLEAMAGHAVTLEDDSLFPYWKVPEPCQAALCVPVASTSTILGTLWMFNDKPRSFSDRETNLVEIIAGRVAAELEREMLLAEAAEG